jgi:hypothetical protein
MLLVADPRHGPVDYVAGSEGLVVDPIWMAVGFARGQRAEWYCDSLSLKEDQDGERF